MGKEKGSNEPAVKKLAINQLQWEKKKEQSNGGKKVAIN